jgi:hypothetical protein
MLAIISMMQIVHVHDDTDPGNAIIDHFFRIFHQFQFGQIPKQV